MNQPNIFLLIAVFNFVTATFRETSIPQKICLKPFLTLQHFFQSFFNSNVFEFSKILLFVLQLAILQIYCKNVPNLNVQH
jgi:hypothetical protein